MQKAATILMGFILGVCSPCFGAPYGVHNSSSLIKPGDSAKGLSSSVNMKEFDEILEDLALHAKNYPTKFDSSQDKIRATKDATILLNISDVLLVNNGRDPNILKRAGFLNSIGHNLDIKGCAPKANDLFIRLLEITPSDPYGNFMYGVFLGGAGKGREAIPYLEKALSLGVVDANYSLGMSNLFIGNTDKALAFFKAYKALRPNDPNVDKIISGIKEGKLNFKHNN